MISNILKYNMLKIIMIMSSIFDLSEISYQAVVAFAIVHRNTGMIQKLCIKNFLVDFNINYNLKKILIISNLKIIY